MRRADGGRAGRKNQRHWERLEFGGEFSLALGTLTCPADFDHEILSFNPPKMAQPRMQRLQVDPAARCGFAQGSEQSNPEDLVRLLCANCERLVQQACAGNDGDECSPVH